MNESLKDKAKREGDLFGRELAEIYTEVCRRERMNLIEFFEYAIETLIDYPALDATYGIYAYLFIFYAWLGLVMTTYAFELYDAKTLEELKENYELFEQLREIDHGNGKGQIKG